MSKENLETKANKSILKIEKKITGMYNVVCDMSLKLDHIIESRRDYCSVSENGYYQ